MIEHAERADGIARDAAGPVSLADVPDFLTVRELARVLRIGRNQAYSLVNSGQVLSCRFGGSIRIPRTAVQRLLDSPRLTAAGSGGDA
jgi:excisionase family DNA binding protein